MLQRPIRWLAPLAVGALALTACGSSSKTVGAGAAPTTQPAATSATSGSSAPASNASAYTVSLQTTKFGKTLVDARGMTLYAFTVDEKGKSNCNTANGCESTWPPLKPSGAIKLGPGLDSGDFKVIMRQDGSQQITDYDAPLYTFSGDSKPGDVKGDGFLGKWYAVGADDKPANAASTVKPVASSSGTPSTEPATTTTAGIPGY
jgi:predicted lipoprotein with Yx(FWY)xxD motif